MTCTPNTHEWDKENEDDVTYRTDSEFDAPMTIRQCCRPGCHALKIHQGGTSGVNGVFVPENAVKRQEHRRSGWDVPR